VAWPGVAGAGPRDAVRLVAAKARSYGRRGAPKRRARRKGPKGRGAPSTGASPGRGGGAVAHHHAWTPPPGRRQMGCMSSAREDGQVELVC